MSLVSMPVSPCLFDWVHLQAVARVHQYVHTYKRDSLLSHCPMHNTKYLLAGEIVYASSFDMTALTARLIMEFGKAVERQPRGNS